MRKFIPFLLVSGMTLIAGPTFALGNTTTIQLGWLNPDATDTGFIIGIGQSRVFDEMVELGVSVDYFSNRHTDEETVSDSSTGGPTNLTTKQVNLETNTIMVPLMANLTIKLPVTSPIKPYIAGSIGYVMLWDKYKNHEEGIDQTKFFSGLGWRVAVGGMYQLGSMSDLTAELFYNGAKPSRDAEDALGLPTFTEVNMSGIGFRFGIKVYL
jgi:hypothetical protein